MKYLLTIILASAMVTVQAQQYQANYDLKLKNIDLSKSRLKNSILTDDTAKALNIIGMQEILKDILKIPLIVTTIDSVSNTIVMD